jgi:hypothetical protein
MKKAAVFALALVLLLPAVCFASSVIMSDNGFLFVSGGFPLGVQGDLLAGVGFVSSAEPPLSADLMQNELTWSIGGLVLADQLQYGATVYTNYAGGTIKISLDPAMNGNYGTNPPNVTSPASFEDGEPFLIGTIVTARMSYNTTRQNGVLQATVNFTNGTAFPTLLQPDGNIVEFTFGPDDPNIPGGYVLQVIGSITAPALCAVRGNVSYVFDSGSCTKCEGITRLVLNYAGTADLSTVSITGGVHFEVTGHQLTITPGSSSTELPGSITISVGGEEAQIQTSCSRPLDPGNVIGSFTVTSVSKIIVPCEAECEGISRLVLQYNGIGDAATVSVSCGSAASVDGALITILPTGTELADNTTVTIGDDAATINTSCDQPLEVGYVFGEYEVVAVDKIASGGGETMPSSGPVVGATVDLLDGEGIAHSTLTDENGDYVFYDLPISDEAVSLVVPLGYSAVTATEVDLVCAPGDIATVDFVVRRMATEDMPRSVGFWKHQVTCALDGKQKGVQVPAGELVQLFAQVHERFDKYFAVFIPVVTLEDLNDVLSVTKGTMYEKARMQFAALALNVVSNRLSTWQFISADHATASQAITYIGGLLTDDMTGNDELAKDIAEAIVNGQTVGAGVIPLTIGQIAYSPPKHKPESGESAAIRNVGNYPNPFNPNTIITYELGREAPVTLAIYNVLGQKVRDLVRDELQNGLNEVPWDGRDNGGRALGSGIYFYRLAAGREVVTNRIILLR